MKFFYIVEDGKKVLERKKSLISVLYMIFEVHMALEGAIQLKKCVCVLILWLVHNVEHLNQTMNKQKG